MEGQPLGHEGVIATLDDRDHARFERDAALACEVDGMASASQQPVHLTRPGFLLDVDQGLEFAQMMGIAQGVKHALHGVCRSHRPAGYRVWSRRGRR